MKRGIAVVGLFAGIILACGGFGEDEEATQETIEPLMEPLVEDISEAIPEPIAEAIEENTPEAPDDLVPEIVENTLEEAQTEPQAGGSLEGTIQDARRPTIVLQVADGNPPPVGSTFTLHKKIDKQFGGMSVTAWLAIGKLSITEITGNQITATIVETQSEVVVDGETQDHFTAGSTIRMDW